MDLVKQPRFQQTTWSEVDQTSDSVRSPREKVLEQLCRLHWPTVYWHARRSGFNSADAEDLTQGFFADILSRESFSSFNPLKGNLRTFLLSAFRRYIVDHRRREAAIKRGGEYAFVSFEDSLAEIDLAAKGRNGESPSGASDRSWAAAILDQAHDMLRCYYDHAGKGELFDRIEPFLDPAGENPDYASVARELDMKPAAVRSTVFRMRRRFGSFILAAVSEAFGGEEDPVSEVFGSFGFSESA